MERNQRCRAMLLLMLACCACLWGQSPPTTFGWHVSVQVAQVRIAVGSDVAPVRNRTSLFEIGRLAVTGIAQ